MNYDSIVVEIRTVIEEIADISKDDITPDSSMIDDLDLSSIEIMTIVSAVERRFLIKVSESELLSISTVGEFAEVVGKKLSSENM